MLRVLVVDPSAIARDRFAAWLMETPGVQADGVALPEEAEKRLADGSVRAYHAIIIDNALPERSCGKLIERLRHDHPEIVVIVRVTHRAFHRYHWMIGCDYCLRQDLNPLPFIKDAQSLKAARAAAQAEQNSFDISSAQPCMAV
ncbi:MAG TPA: hypothetical protein VJ001_02620 [Rhodocyclaceae bacterium]|nr:hypothetical protein [Rhodocyclaceae bacterium]